MGRYPNRRQPRAGQASTHDSPCHPCPGMDRESRPVEAGGLRGADGAVDPEVDLGHELPRPNPDPNPQNLSLTLPLTMTLSLSLPRHGLSDRVRLVLMAGITASSTSEPVGRHLAEGLGEANPNPTVTRPYPDPNPIPSPSPNPNEPKRGAR